MIDRNHALAYFSTPSNGCWRWAENGSVVVWHDGTTVAFREEIVAVLEQLAPQKLPPFSAIALFLAACRGKVPSVGQVIDSPQPVLTTQHQLVSTARRQLTVQVEGELKELEKIRALPPDLSTGLIPKAVLAEILFESAQAERHTEAAPVLAGLREALTDNELNAKAGAKADNVRHVFIIGQGLKPHSVESLRLRVRTALDALPSPAELELAPAERAHRFLDDLAKDTELSGMARAARELMAAIRLPRKLAERDELALGGVSDITNRGSLDRLLLSELAHDDLTLAVRVALNEALYVRREPPAHQPPSSLALVLDSGVRLWGLPRIFAVSVALAFVAKESQRKNVSAWRAQDNTVARINLLTKDGLSKHLEALETTAHPGAALEEFVRQQKDQGDEAEPTDVILITHEDTLADPEFRQAVTKTNPVGFIATVSREGAFALHELPLAPRPPLCEAKLDIQQLFTERRSAARLVNPEVNPDLPAIFRETKFPFLLPVKGKVNGTTVHGEHTFALMDDGRLLRWRTNENGAEQIATGLPPGRTDWIKTDDSGTLSIIKGRQGKKELILLRVDPNSGVRAEYLFAGIHYPIAFHQQGETLLIIEHGRTNAFDTNTGMLLGRAEKPAGLIHSSQRFFRSSNFDWYFVSWNGHEVVWDKLVLPAIIRKPIEPQLPEDWILTIFNREEFQMPLVIMVKGSIYSLDGEKVFNSGRRGKSARISRDGSRLVVKDLDGKRQHLIDLAEGTFRPSERPERELEPYIPPLREMWMKFKAIHRHDLLRLYSPKDGGLKIAAEQIISQLVRNSPCPPDAIKFRHYPSPRSLGCHLRVAEWPNGSRAFLDSRGLLHLKSHDRTLPEISIVLSKGPMAAWCSNGAFGGPSFFCNGEDVSRPDEIFEVLRKIVERL
jgi:hypothetical protein